MTKTERVIREFEKMSKKMIQVFILILGVSCAKADEPEHEPDYEQSDMDEMEQEEMSFRDERPRIYWPFIQNKCAQVKGLEKSRNNSIHVLSRDNRADFQAQELWHRTYTCDSPDLSVDNVTTYGETGIYETAEGAVFYSVLNDYESVKGISFIK